MHKYLTTQTFRRNYYASFTMSHCMYALLSLTNGAIFYPTSLNAYCNCCCFFGIQADPETDEVYAQMTLQPVPSVGFSPG